MQEDEISDRFECFTIDEAMKNGKEAKMSKVAYIQVINFKNLRALPEMIFWGLQMRSLPILRSLPG